MTKAEQLARFVVRAEYTHIPAAAKERLKIHLLDSLGCAFAARSGEPIRYLREQLHEFGGIGLCTVIGGGRAAPDRAAMYNGALVRYLDFMDSYMVRGETCHPCDNLGSILAAAEYAQQSGQEFLTALAVGYEVQCRLTDATPVMREGFDHTLQLAYSVASGVARALTMSENSCANALGLAGSQYATLAIIRASPGSHWKGIASANTAAGALSTTFLAHRGMTGPRHIFEGPKGLEEMLGKPLNVDWSRVYLDSVLRASLKSYNAEVHTQSAVEAMLELRQQSGSSGKDVKRIELTTFHEAYDIVGGGSFGDRKTVGTKEQADHSLPYTLAVALLDGEVMPEQYLPERIRRADVQALLQRVTVRRKLPVRRPKLVTKLDAYERRYPAEMPCHLKVRMRDGRTFEIEKHDYAGFHTRPFSWQQAQQKFERLTTSRIPVSLQQEIEQAVKEIESIRVPKLTALLGRTQLL